MNTNHPYFHFLMDALLESAIAFAYGESFNCDYAEHKADKIRDMAKAWDDAKRREITHTREQLDTLQLLQAGALAKQQEADERGHLSTAQFYQWRVQGYAQLMRQLEDRLKNLKS